MDAMTMPLRPRAGRPTREQAEARHAELLEAALDHFLDKGFDTATVEAIAATVNMTKRTVYARYPDKVSLFRAAVRRAIEQFATPPEQVTAMRGATLEETLLNIGRLRVQQVTTPQGLKLQRIINTESYRFPDIFTSYYELAAMPVIRFLTELLRAENAAGRLALDDPQLAANVFMAMVTSGPVRIIVSGNKISPTEIDRRVEFGVKLFLNGARPR
ncbi:MAG: TetR/AcrR family transcriptional regulator [Novosphingobium sp.]|nr:TetR/AcrR family transcriptional regulator [Novosphingobium sp.]